MSLSVVILAAGKGTRMKSAKAKVLHELAGKPLLGHVIDVAKKLSPEKCCVVYGHGGEQLQQAFADDQQLTWIEQKPQLGTGHAVQQTLDSIEGSDAVLVLYGDVPLIRQPTLERLLQLAEKPETLALLTAKLEDPAGYGRIIRNDSGQVTAIVEEKDATAEQKAVNEINTGIMVLPGRKLREWLERINNSNAQGEYYLTDIIELAVKDGFKVLPLHPEVFEETMGVNSRQQLAELERFQQRQIAEQLMAQGVTIKDPSRFDLRGEIEVGRDIVIDVGVVLTGKIKIGDNVTIEPFCVIKDSEIAENASIHSHSVLEHCRIGKNSSIGPFARLRPDTQLAEDTKIGNFVEVKKSNIGSGSKVNHLSYIGDTEIGQNVNVGAGTITCNYDGANKHRTIIEDGAFIGSDTQLVAPVKVGRNSTIGAGSTVTKDTPEGGLTLSRAKQSHIDNWQRPVKKNKS